MLVFFVYINDKKRKVDMEKIANKLLRLFDYQRFDRQKKLQSLIEDVKQRYDDACVLTDSDLSFALGGKQEEKKKDKLNED